MRMSECLNVHRFYEEVAEPKIMGVPACNAIFKENLVFSYKESLMDKVNKIKMTCATILEPCA